MIVAHARQDAPTLVAEVERLHECELLDASNREVERRRLVEAQLEAARPSLAEMQAWSLLRRP